MNAQTTQRILEKASTLGASLAGVVRVSDLKQSPSHQREEITHWSSDDYSVLVLALAHPRTSPELDWWDSLPGGTPGNRQLMAITEHLTVWLDQEFGLRAHDLSYQIAQGGIFLKDAAALAGLGVIGKNNLLITPQFGIQVRLRALLIETKLRASAPLDFAPCVECDMPCLRACPQNAFDDDGYRRSSCNQQMATDEANPAKSKRSTTGSELSMVIKYCRRCELACPVAQ